MLAKSLTYLPWIKGGGGGHVTARGFYNRFLGLLKMERSPPWSFYIKIA